MKRFPRGSEWRKWDLHVHVPGTKLSDEYQLKNGRQDWDRFCRVIHDSDVQAIGIADYFSLDGFFSFRENYDRLYPDSEKVFFPNLELRLNETVNRAAEAVDFHVIFRPDLTREKATEFLRELKTQNTDDKGKPQSCVQLKTGDDFEKATVSRVDIQSAMDATFGKKAVGVDHVILIAAANNSGIRADTGNKRKMNLADEIDKLADAFFGNPTNTAYFLDPKRLEAADQTVAPKPVFAGSDPHSFDQLSAWLGTEVTGGNAKHVTWIKADLTFEGLQQTLIEPDERVRIQATPPDRKEPYKVISRIAFADSGEFPDEVVFNPGLNAIIGPRSSGKSALLSYVAYAVDPVYTVTQQIAANGMDASEVGPGASITWTQVRDIKYVVEWAAPAAKAGRVIYVPQGALYALSRQPDDITARIRPTVFRNSPEFEATFRKTQGDVEMKNEFIRSNVESWFSLAETTRTLMEQIRGLGDRNAIAQRQSELTKEIETLRESSPLTSEEVERYQEVMGETGKNKSRLKAIEQELRDMDPYVATGAKQGAYKATDQVSITVSMAPALATLPSGLQARLQILLDTAKTSLLDGVKAAFAEYRAALDTEQRNLTGANERLAADNSELIEKNVANVQIAALIRDRTDQDETLATIDREAALLQRMRNMQSSFLSSIAVDIRERDAMLTTLADDFNVAGHAFEDMAFTIEVDYDTEEVDRVSRGFNKHETSPYIVDQKRVNLTKASSESGAFVEYVGGGRQKLNQGEHAVALTQGVLMATKSVRFVASLEGDRIGGFRPSSMTPGKQALFALTLILAESGEPWPLLIDQPEDDLDSRSVCEVIVKDLMRRKRERQIILVSHDANLVIGADSEEVIVANRHGDDRPNRGAKKFAYLTGSLEHSVPRDPRVKTVLDTAGIREHACDILDGGAEAFQKRKDKYRI